MATQVGFPLIQRQSNKLFGGSEVNDCRPKM